MGLFIHNKKAQGIKFIVGIAIAIIVLLMAITAIRTTGDTALRSITDYAFAAVNDFDNDNWNDLTEIIMGRDPCGPDGSNSQQKYNAEDCRTLRSAYYRNKGKVFTNDFVSGISTDPFCTHENIGEACGKSSDDELNNAGLCGAAGQCLTYCRFCSFHADNKKCKGSELKRRLEGAGVTVTGGRGGIQEQDLDQWPFAGENVGCLCQSGETIQNVPGSQAQGNNPDNNFNPLLIGATQKNLICHAAELNNRAVAYGGTEGQYFCCDEAVVSAKERVAEAEEGEAAIKVLGNTGDCTRAMTALSQAKKGTGGYEIEEEGKLALSKCIKLVGPDCASGTTTSCAVLNKMIYNYLNIFPNDPVIFSYSGNDLTIQFSILRVDGKVLGVTMPDIGAWAQERGKDDHHLITDYDSQFRLVQKTRTSGPFTPEYPNYEFIEDLPGPIDTFMFIKPQTDPKMKEGLEFVYD